MAYPTSYTPALFAEICERLSKGESLRRICEDDGMPDRHTVVAWCEADEAKQAQYARARDRGLDALAEECLRIADTPLEGTTEKTNALGTEVTKGDMFNHRRLQVDTRKWYLSKLAPKRYGDRLELAGKVFVEQSHQVFARDGLDFVMHVRCFHHVDLLSGDEPVTVEWF